MRRWGGAVVGHAGFSRPGELLGGMRLEDVYTPAERVRSAAGRTLEHWAGRLAGKRAVVRLLGLPPLAHHLGQVEILPLPAPDCRAGAACLDGHPPAVRLTGEPARRAGPHRVRVSISHTATHALAVALCSAPLPEDARPDALTVGGEWEARPAIPVPGGAGGRGAGRG
ncbi:phosphopantetheinyl transferase [Nonomuraea sp. CA-218870]|uniref:phosphopantetheinyl transferase n=1 Tax=Nonomuraea sp. CA-218870 TaxID=3239998 RepID=UPI003D8C3E01